MLPIIPSVLRMCPPPSRTVFLSFEDSVVTSFWLEIKHDTQKRGEKKKEHEVSEHRRSLQGKRRKQQSKPGAGLQKLLIDGKPEAMSKRDR